MHVEYSRSPFLFTIIYSLLFFADNGRVCWSGPSRPAGWSPLANTIHQSVATVFLSHKTSQFQPSFRPANGANMTRRKVHWLSWETLSQRKSLGGLGYRDLHLFNLAMLARQGGDFCRHQTQFMLRFCKRSTSQVGTFWRQRSNQVFPIRGEIFCMESKPLKRANLESW